MNQTIDGKGYTLHTARRGSAALWVLGVCIACTLSTALLIPLSDEETRTASPAADRAAVDLPDVVFDNVVQSLVERDMQVGIWPAIGDFDGDGVLDTLRITDTGDAVIPSGTVEVQGGERRRLLARLVGSAEDDAFGAAASFLDDVSGDGYSDVIVGAPLAGDGQGRAYVFSFPDAEQTPVNGNAEHAWRTVLSPVDGAILFGDRVGPIFDLTRDGIDDIRVRGWRVDRNGALQSVTHFFDGRTGAFLFFTTGQASEDLWEPLPGDLTGDGRVGTEDINLLIERIGLEGAGLRSTDGDLNGDGRIGPIDLAMAVRHRGRRVLPDFDPRGGLGERRRPEAGGGTLLDFGTPWCCVRCPEYVFEPKSEGDGSGDGIWCGPQGSAPDECADPGPGDCVAGGGYLDPCNIDPCGPACPMADCDPACGGGPCDPGCPLAPCDPQCGGGAGPCAEECPTAKCDPACGGNPCLPECIFFDEFDCNDPCLIDPCHPGCESMPCDDPCGYDPCHPECETEECDDPCRMPMVPVGRDPADDYYACVEEIMWICAGDCEDPDECDDDPEPCEPDELTWSLTGPVEVLGNNGECLAVRYTDPGLANISVSDGCCEGELDMNVVDIKLRSVTFGDAPGKNNNHPVARDSNGMPYETPHWKRLAEDDACTMDPFCCSGWDSTFALYERRHPVAYTMGTRITAQSVVFDADLGGASPANITVKGYAGGSTPLFQGSGVYQNGKITASSLVASQPESNHIAYYEHAAIVWEVELDDQLMGCSIGESRNDFYMTLDEPDASPLFHTVVHLACKHGVGAGAPEGAVDQIWFYFEGMTVQNHAGEPIGGIKYWGPNGAGCASTHCLINNYDGQCGAWARFFRDVLKVHGVPAQLAAVVPSAQEIPDTVPNPDGGELAVVDHVGFDVQWTLHPNAPWEPRMVYPQGIVPSGIPGQGGVDNPESRFSDHALVIVENGLYDPSYGFGPYAGSDALRDWQASSLSSVIVQVHKPGEGNVLYHLLNDGASWDRLVEIAFLES